MSAAGLVIILGSSPIITDEERSARLFVPVGICGDIPPPVPVLHNGSAVVEVGCCSGEQVRADRGMNAIRADVARSQPLLLFSRLSSADIDRGRIVPPPLDPPGGGH